MYQKPAVALLALTLALAVPATASASPTTSPSPTASGNSDLRPEQGSAKVASKAASFTSQVDDPHYSSSHAGSVNVHGWWLDDHDNFTGMKARVTVYLWAKKGVAVGPSEQDSYQEESGDCLCRGEAAANEPQDQYPVVATNLLGITDKLM